jgi:CheY-like chemotaxis protein
MDIHMPELDGFEATAAIRASANPHVRNIPVVALTADAMQDDRQRCLESGMDDYLAKPLKAAELSRVLEAVANGRPPTVSRVEESPEISDRPQAASTGFVAVDASTIINWETAHRQIPGDEDTFLELLAAFGEECQRFLDEIRDGIEAGDAKSVRTAAHTLKSSAELFAAEQVFSVALRLERMVKEENVTGARELLGTLEMEINRLAEVIAAGPSSERHAWQPS